MRKKTHALTAREKPKLYEKVSDVSDLVDGASVQRFTKAMYCSCCALDPRSATVRPADEGTVLATWAPLRASRRKSDVPTNSPVVAYDWVSAAGEWVGRLMWW